jgi:hypothetical protein
VSTAALDWSTVRPAVRADRTFGYVLVPAFAIGPLEWKGSSEIVQQYNYSASKNFALRSRPTKPTDADYVLCIRYRVGDTVTRYKLWDDGDLRLPNVELYAGQIIKKNFCIEVWSLLDSTTATQLTDITLRTGIMRAVTDLTSTPADFSDASGTAATLAITPLTLASPASYGTLNLWLKSDTGITLDGSDATDWEDQSGAGYSLTRDASADVPVYVSSGFGDHDKPYLRFLNDRYLAKLTSPASAFQCYYIALQVDVWASGGTIIFDGSKLVTLDPTNNKIRSEWVVNSDVDFASVAAKPFILRLDRTNIPQSTNRVQVVSLDDYITEVSIAATSTGLFGSALADYLYLGSADGTACDFRIAEVLGFNAAALTEANDLLVKQYLSQKYSTAQPIPLTFDAGSAWLDNS